MKTYNLKLAILVFAAIVALAAIDYFFRHSITSEWFAVPLAVIYSPGILLWHSVGGFVRGNSSHWCLVAGCVLFSAFVWSLISGFAFRRKYAA